MKVVCVPIEKYSSRKPVSYSFVSQITSFLPSQLKYAFLLFVGIQHLY